MNTLPTFVMVSAVVSALAAGPDTAGEPPCELAPPHERHAPVGYPEFHPDVQINYQLNRVLPGRVEDRTRIAPRIKDFADWKREMLAIADEALREGRLVHAAYWGVEGMTC